MCHINFRKTFLRQWVNDCMESEALWGLQDLIKALCKYRPSTIYRRILLGCIEMLDNENVFKGKYSFFS